MEGSLCRLHMRRMLGWRCERGVTCREGALATAVCRKPPSIGGGQYTCCANASRASSPRGLLAAVMRGYLGRWKAQLCKTSPSLSTASMLSRVRGESSLNIGDEAEELSQVQGVPLPGPLQERQQPLHPGSWPPCALHAHHLEY
jgi:hypothetical protein